MLTSNVRGLLLSAAEVSPLHELRRESLIFHRQQKADSIFLIDRGLVKLTRTGDDGSRIILSVLGPNQVIGEESVGDVAQNYASEARCLTDVTAYQVPAAAVARLFGIPEVAVALFSYLLGRQSDFLKKTETLALHDVEHRILHGLAELARLVGVRPGATAFPIPMTQAEIASYVGATRETTSTTLNVLKERRLLTLSRRLVTTVHPDILLGAANNRLTHAQSVA